MKKICNFLKNLVIFAYIVLIIFVTVCLLSYNDYKVTVFGTNTVIPVIDDDLEPEYKLGDLLIVEKNKLSSIKEGDEVFFYKVAAGEVSISYANITNTERTGENEYEFTVEGDYSFSSSNFIGKTETAIIVPEVGRALSILQSKWGFLFLVVFPSLIAFLYTLYSVILELKGGSEEIEESETPKNEKDINESSVEDGKKNDEETVKEFTSDDSNENELVNNSDHDLENVTETEKNQENNEENNEEINSENIENSEEDTENMENIVEISESNQQIENEKSINQEIKSEESINQVNREQTIEEKRKALIQEKLKAMTPEEKKALVEAKLNAMTPEERRAFIEARRKKKEENNT